MLGSSSSIKSSILVLLATAIFGAFVLLPASPAQAVCFKLTIRIGTYAIAEGPDAMGTAENLGTGGGGGTGVDAQSAAPAKAPADKESKTEVLKIAAGTDTVNLGEKAVPLGELKEKPEATTEESEAGRETQRRRGLDFKVEKRNPHDINITIGENRHYGDGKDIVRFGEDVVVAEADTVDGDVVSIGGSVTVNGKVGGDCVSIGGCINIGPHGIIEGDGVSVGGCINREPGSVLKGDEVVTGGKIPNWIFRGGWPQYGLSGLKFVGFAFAVGKALVVLFLIWLIVLISRDRVKVTSDKARSNLLASFGIGLLVVILTPIAMVLLCITLIGIPVAILLPLALVIAGLFGYAAVGLAVGTKVFGGDARATSAVKAALVGVLLMEAIPIVGRLIGLPGGFLWGLSIPVRIIGYAIMGCAGLIGLGATIMTKFGQAPKAPPYGGGGGGGAAPVPGAAAATPGPVPQAPSVPGYGAPPSGT